MKKIIVAMIGIAFAFCCFMLLDGCNSTEITNSEEEAVSYTVSYDDVISKDIEDSCWDYEYASYSIYEYPSEENDGWLKYITYDADGNALTVNSVRYDWAASHFND